MTNLIPHYTGKLAVWMQNKSDCERANCLANYLNVPVYTAVNVNYAEDFFLTYSDNILRLLDKSALKNEGLWVNVHPRAGEQRSYPAPKKGVLAQSLGHKTKTVLDATTGWGQDALFMFRLGYQVQCLERSKLMTVLLQDAFQRLMELTWVQTHQLQAPKLTQGDAIVLLSQLQTPPDCIYLDPMFPPKRKNSALAKKPMQVLQKLLGQDEDRTQLFAAAWEATSKRVVVKSPSYALPLGGKPSLIFTSKLLRYDVYLKFSN